jgi:hypothetical protein
MRIAAAPLVLLVMLTAPYGAVGCSVPTERTTDPFQQTAQADPPAAAEGYPEQQPIDRFTGASQRFALPAGQVPPVVVGRWSGGENNGTKEYLIIAQDGSYGRGKNGQYPYDMGVIIASGQQFVTVAVNGAQQPGRWSYQNAAGIEVLGIYLGSHYYSYTRF